MFGLKKPKGIMENCDNERPTRQNGAANHSQDVEQGGGEQEPQVLCLSKMSPGATFNIVTDHQN